MQAVYNTLLQAFELVFSPKSTLRNSRTGLSVFSHSSLPVVCQTQDDVFHKVFGFEYLDYAELVLASKPNLEVQQCQVLAKNMFNTLLLVCQGQMTLHMQLPKVLAVANLNRKPGMVLKHDTSGYWTIDDEPCITSTPILNFDKMPKDVIKVTANYISHRNVAWVADAEDVQIHLNHKCASKR